MTTFWDQQDDRDLRPNRIADRSVDELLGHCRSLAAKDCLEQPDVLSLQKWLSRQRHITGVPFLAEVANTVRGLSTRRPSQEDLDRLHDLICKLVGGADPAKSLPSSMPLDEPAPFVTFEGKKFCFTGTFDFGERELCTRETILRGASVVPSLTKKTDYLVVGANVTETWKHSSFGNKIMVATKWRHAGCPIAIISESHWRDALLEFASRPIPSRVAVGRTERATVGDSTSWQARPAVPSTSRPSIVVWFTSKRYPVWYFPAIVFVVSFVAVWFIRH